MRGITVSTSSTLCTGRTSGISALTRWNAGFAAAEEGNQSLAGLVKPRSLPYPCRSRARTRRSDKENRMRVLFACVENSCRSQMAEAFANMLGVDGVEAWSAGSEPSGQLNDLAVEVMRELGYDLRVHESKSVDEVPDVEFD